MGASKSIQVPPAEAIDEFWKWFEEHAAALRNLRPQSTISRDLEHRVSKLGNDAWEIGPTRKDGSEMFFALSAKGSREVYAFNRAIMARSPAIEGWKFLPSKPRKDWRRRFEWPGSSTVDASKWKFMIYTYPDGMYDLCLVGKMLESLDDNEKRRVLAFVVESELGEALALEKINRLELNESSESDDFDKAVEISRLFACLGGQRSH